MHLEADKHKRGEQKHEGLNCGEGGCLSKTTSQ